MKKYPNDKLLKVSYGYHSNSCKKRPSIRLCGDYLSALDFKVGDTIKLTASEGEIVISKVHQNIKPE